MQTQPLGPLHVRLGYGCLGLSQFSRVATDLWQGRLAMARGELFPYRHLPWAPLTGPFALYLEWGSLLLGGGLLMSKAGRRAGLWLCLASQLWGLGQGFSNYRCLAVATTLLLVFSAKGKDAAEGQQATRRALAAQLAMVYGFSALHKVRGGFANGYVIAHFVPQLAPAALPLAIATIALELTLAAMMLLRPRWAIWPAALFHLGLCIAISGIWPFGFWMLGAIFLSLDGRVQPQREPHADQHGLPSP